MKKKSDERNSIIDYVITNIRSGAWKPGEKITSENQISKELHVSRMMVRSALQPLFALGMLRSEQGRGTYLVSKDTSMFLNTEALLEYRLPESEDYRRIVEFMQFRCMVEPPSAGMVAEHASDGFTERIGKYLGLMEKAASIKDSPAFVYADHAFHMAICRETKNELLISVMAHVFKQNEDHAFRLNRMVGYYSGLYYHRLLFEAFQEKDGRKAMRLMDEHLRHSLRDMMGV